MQQSREIMLNSTFAIFVGTTQNQKYACSHPQISLLKGALPRRVQVMIHQDMRQAFLWLTPARLIRWMVAKSCTS